MKVDLPVISPNIRTHDNTMMSDYARCPRLYCIHHVLGKRKRGEKDTALGYGGLLHVGFDNYYKGLMETGNVAKALLNAIEHIKAAHYVDPKDDKDVRTKGRALHDIKEYAINYGLEPLWQVFMSETSFDIQDEEGFRFGGIIDLGVMYHGRPWPVDHKSTSRFTAFYFDNFKMEPQMMGYHWGFSKLHGEDPPGVFINVIIIHKNKTEFKRKPIMYSKSHIEQWRQRAIARYREITALLEQDPNGEQWNNVHIWTPNFENCIGKFHRPCPAFGVCHGLPQNAAIRLNMEFVDGKWDWTTRDEEGNAT